MANAGRGFGVFAIGLTLPYPLSMEDNARTKWRHCCHPFCCYIVLSNQLHTQQQQQQRSNSYCSLSLEVSIVMWSTACMRHLLLPLHTKENRSFAIYELVIYSSRTCSSRGSTYIFLEDTNAKNGRYPI